MAGVPILNGLLVNGAINFNGEDVDIRRSGTKNIYLDETYSMIRIGKNAGNDSITGYYNTLIGYQAGQALTSGASNLLFGFQAGNSITEGLRNVVIGSQAGQAIMVTAPHS